MSSGPRFLSASPYQQDVLQLPVAELDVAADWYCAHFQMREESRQSEPVPAVVLERDGVCLGFAVNGGDSSQDGAAIRVSQIEEIRSELAGRGVTVSEMRIDERDGGRLRVFFVVAPDGLCFYFHEPIVE